MPDTIALTISGAALAGRMSEQALRDAEGHSAEVDRLGAQLGALPWWRWRARRQLLAEIRFHIEAGRYLVFVSEFLDGDGGQP